MLHELLCCDDIALSDAVEDRRLPISVEMVYVRSLFNQDFNSSIMTLSYCIVDW